jgi:hypothetical protein
MYAHSIDVVASIDLLVDCEVSRFAPPMALPHRRFMLRSPIGADLYHLIVKKPILTILYSNGFHANAREVAQKICILFTIF